MGAELGPAMLPMLSVPRNRRDCVPGYPAGSSKCRSRKATQCNPRDRRTMYPLSYRLSSRIWLLLTSRVLRGRPSCCVSGATCGLHTRTPILNRTGSVWEPVHNQGKSENRRKLSCAQGRFSGESSQESIMTIRMGFMRLRRKRVFLKGCGNLAESSTRHKPNSSWMTDCHFSR